MNDEEMRAVLRRAVDAAAEVYHVYPLGELHDVSVSDCSCWCGPRRDEDEYRVIIHNSRDQLGIAEPN